MRKLRSFIVLVGLAAIVLGSGAMAQGSSPIVDLVEVRGLIDAPTADYMSTRLEAAAESSDVIVIQLDTPGGLDVPMRSIIQEMLDSPIPVVVWIAPRGARAASAGVFITYAADLAFMAATTEIGAATPVNLGGRLDPTLARKVTEDAAAFLGELARTNRRDETFAAEAVRDATSIGVTEAVERGVVDGQASSLEDLLRAMDGRSISIEGDMAETVIESWDEERGVPSATVRFQQMNLLQRLLHAITDPEVAFFLVLIGAFGIIFELYNPGIGLAGMLGGVGILMGFYALSALPTNWAAAALVVLGVALFLVDLHIAGLGVWTAGGVVALVSGGLLLFSGAPDVLRLSPISIAVAVVVTLLFFISVMTAALRVRLRRPITGEEGIVGTIGEATTDIAPEGTVMTKGTLWRARTMETGIAAGSKVQVKATEGLVLLVEPLHDE
ncbi:MAG TPA: nodulation protein NfeD [Actinomycetota bacterium]|nr:nodulation protein NfeD [Actinomycetota bacterium]